MNLIYENPGFDYSLDSILAFFDENEGTSSWWQDPLFRFYPQLEKEVFLSFTLPRRKNYLKQKLTLSYDEKLFEQKAKAYSAYWKEHQNQITDGFSDAFEKDVSPLFNQIKGNITLNPIQPRFLEEQRFDVFYLCSHRGAMGTALHEIIHFVWFDLWHDLFKDDKSHYELPHLKWIFSEMVVDPIMLSDERLYSLNPYAQEGCAYEAFYTMTIGTEPILKTLATLYQNLTIKEFMVQGYEYCLLHQKEIISQSSFLPT